ncbi:beta-lactamase/transpeptidase-like protein [Massariosphaeria phaeospora]|uniref:Beta-lactamase/transpeptidase-like protein n=1 Tax=Massariosphaeria phaeospora TaxID=100035 RepID=A0A7C8IB22_9PLEO|nr:beta-lactamase/transpeptidase-like protein [Massariosphaeria phaeospora]
MPAFEQAYTDAIEAKILPGYALLAGDKHGQTLHASAAGVQSLKPGSTRPFQLDTVCAIASMTKLMTAIAALQCVERGLLDLDASVKDRLPGIARYGIITGFDDEKNEAVLTPEATPITLRMLLAYTNGHEYDALSPLLTKWRASRGETPGAGSTVEQKSTLPLVFAPGTSWRYGAGSDWAGKLIERASGQTLETFMRAHIWTPLGISDMTFFPHARPAMAARLATISTLDAQGAGPAADAPDFDILTGGTECLGGVGAYASTAAYFPLLQAVLRRDTALLSPASWTELLRPQLDARCKAEFNAYLTSSPLHMQYLGMGLPASVVKTWSFAGMVCEEGVEGRMGKGAVMWGGLPSMAWWVDSEAGLCGVAACQVMPPMAPVVMALHEGFQRGVYGEYGMGVEVESKESR